MQTTFYSVVQTFNNTFLSGLPSYVSTYIGIVLTIVLFFSFVALFVGLFVPRSSRTVFKICFLSLIVYSILYTCNYRAELLESLNVPTGVNLWFLF